MNRDRKPLPRFWYFPRGEKAVVVMTGDDHGSGGTGGPLRQPTDARARPAARVADWECVRGDLVRLPGHAASPTRRRRPTRPQGFEVGAARQHRAAPTGRRRRSQRLLRDQLAAFAAQLPERSAPPRPTARTASRGATGRPSRRSSSSTASASTRTTTTGRRPGSRTGPASSPARACRCASPTSTAR